MTKPSEKNIHTDQKTLRETSTHVSEALRAALLEKPTAATVAEGIVCASDELNRLLADKMKKGHLEAFSVEEIQTEYQAASFKEKLKMILLWKVVRRVVKRHGWLYNHFFTYQEQFSLDILDFVDRFCLNWSVENGEIPEQTINLLEDIEQNLNELRPYYVRRERNDPFITLRVNFSIAPVKPLEWIQINFKIEKGQD